MASGARALGSPLNDTRLSQQDSLWKQWEDLNRLDTLSKVSLFSVIMGIVTGIIILTGFDVTPEGTIQYATAAIASAFAQLLGPYSQLVSFLIFAAFLFYGIVQTIRSIRIILSYGLAGIIVGTTGFSSGLIVMLFTGNSLGGYLFVILALVSLGVSWLAGD